MILATKKLQVLKTHNKELETSLGLTWDFFSEAVRSDRVFETSVIPKSYINRS